MPVTRKPSHLEIVLLVILVIFHAVGLCAFYSPYWRPLILPYSALNLVLAFFVLAVSFHRQLIHFIVFMLICFTAGMAFEWIGVHTGLLFGDYAYGYNLGPKLWGVPLIIGINWGLVAIASGVVAAQLSASHFYRAVIASLLMVFLDFLIEPVAVALGYWTWRSPEIPVYNYICWFLLSLPLNFLFTQFALHEQNRVAIGLYFIFAVFFGCLNWI